jgi:hypothetical protein
MDMNPGSAAACGSVIKIDTLKARAESDASFCAATADLADVDIFTIVHAKSVASLVTGIIHAGLDRSDVEPEPIVAPKSFQRSGMSQFGMQFGMQFGIQGNQKLKSMPPLDQSLTRVDGRMVPNRKSEIAVKADQKLKSMPPLDQSLTRADGRMVPNRKSEIGVVVTKTLRNAPPIDPSHIMQNGSKVESRMQEMSSTSRLGTMNVSANHRELQLRWGHGHSCKILGTIPTGNENVWAASSTSYATSRDALRSLYEHAANERLSREYEFSNLPKYLKFNRGWNCEPPFTDELQKYVPGSFGNLLRELVANEKLDVKVVQIQAMSKSKRVKRKDSNR